MPVCYRSKGAASHVRSANPFTQLSDGGCTWRHRFPQPTPTPFLVAGHTPFEHPPLSKEIRTSCDLDVGLTGLAWSPGRSPRLMKIFELGWAHTYTHTHTHASGYTFRRLSPEYGNFAIYLINFCLFHIERRMWKINGAATAAKGTKAGPNYFICHTHCHYLGIAIQQKSCWQIKTENVIRDLCPIPPIPSLAVSVFIYLYINVFLPVAPAAHFKLIVRQLACGAFIQFSSYMYASRYAYVVYFIYKRIYRYIWHILILHIRSRDKLTCNSCQRGVSSGGHCKK